MKIGVVGLGVVGRHMVADIERAGHAAVGYDIARHFDDVREKVNACDAAFVCVPTAMGPGGAADLSAVDDVFGWLDVPVAIIRSTVPPGTTERLQLQQRSRSVVFVPEFIGEGVNSPYNGMRQPPFLLLGGTFAARQAAAGVLAHLYNAECEFLALTAKEAEIAKYAENTFLALKVTWANEFYDICQHYQADYSRMMNALTHDYRIGRSHTHVYPDSRGWGGRCLPKDTAALRAAVGAERAPLLDAVIAVNRKHRGEA